MSETLATGQTIIGVEKTDPPITQTRTISELVEEFGYWRNVARVVRNDLGDGYQRALQIQLDEKASQIARRRSCEEMLNELSQRGFAWRDIARMVGVSVPAVRRWRLGESPTPENLTLIGRLLALVDLLGADHSVADVASLMEMPIVQESPLTAIDLASENRYIDVLELASDHIQGSDVMDRWHPDWRNEYQSEFEVFRAADGETGIRLRDRTLD